MKTKLLPLAFLFALTLPWLASVAATDSTSAATPPAQFNVRDYGAVGDGQAKDTAAFQKALDACAASKTGGDVVVPAGNYTVGSVTMGSNTTLRLENGAFILESPDIADYPMTTSRFEGETVPCHRSTISANGADHVAIIGAGASTCGFYARSALCYPSNRNPRAPLVIEAVNCNDVTFADFSLQYDEPAGRQSQIWCIHPNFCTNVVLRGLYIRSSRNNGDGLDIDSDSGVLVDHCDISTGDDAISIKSGRGQAAVQLAKPTENLVIKDSTLRSVNFAALGFGTEVSGGLSNITISNCTISGVQNAIFIKSRDGRGGTVDGITGDNITVDQSPTFIGIDLISKGIQATDPVTDDLQKWTQLRNVSFKNIHVNNVRTLVEAQHSTSTAAHAGGEGVPPERPIDGFTLANITGTCQNGIVLNNVVHANFSGIAVTGYTGPLLTLSNVTGTGLDDASAAAPAKTAGP